MDKTFLEIIDDTKNRVFPLNYKYVTSSEMPESVKNRRYITIELYNTNEYEAEEYHKPISKVF